MKKAKKRIVAIVLPMLALLCIVFLSGREVRAEILHGDTYLPYEGAKYSLSYHVTDEGIIISGISDYQSKEDLGVVVIPQQIDGIVVTKIGNHAFSGCSGLTGELKLPEGLTTIGDCAFYECRGLTGELKLPEGLTMIGYNAFSGCRGLTGELKLPEGLTTIGSSAFSGCRGLTGELKLPEGLTTIEDYVFYDCRGLSGELKLPEGLITIGSAAFYDCRGLSGELKLPEGLITIGSAAFHGCSGLSGELKLPEGLTTIEASTFADCSGLTGELKLPEGVTTIGLCAFYGCRGLTGELKLPEGVTTIGLSAFYECSNLSGELKLPEGLTTIGDWAFYGCCDLSGELKLPEGLTMISARAFMRCFSLTGVTIPEGVTTIGVCAFADCRGLTGELKLPEGLTTIEASAFVGCSGLTGELKLPKGLTTIESNAFYRCSGITRVTIPEGVTTIEKTAFRDCQKVTSVWFEGDAPSSVSFEESFGEGTKGYYPARKIGWEEVIAANQHMEWVMYEGEIPDFVPEVPTPEEQVLDFVERMYTVALGRDAEKDGANWWTNELLNGTRDGAGIASGFLLSPEFVNKTISNGDYVNVLYKTFFDREPAAEEVGYWVGEIERGKTREYVLSGFVNSEEFEGLCAEYGIARGIMRGDGTCFNAGILRFTERLYTKALERESDQSGVEYWARCIEERTVTPEDAAKSFFTLPEYVNKNTTDEQYVKALYRTFMDREAEGGGLEYWVNCLSNGESRELVLGGFAQSDEFKGIMADCGL